MKKKSVVDEKTYVENLGRNNLKFLNDQEKLDLNHIRAAAYINLFAFILFEFLFGIILYSRLYWKLRTKN